MTLRVSKTIPVIDLFAGPGGLGEGFAALDRKEGKKYFKIGLSVENDPSAHATLLLRSFFRQFEYEDVPPEYYAFLRGEISLHDLFNFYPSQAAYAKREAWCAELGSGNEFNLRLDEKIERIIGSSKKWVLIGGPPCQAYSIAGRSRNRAVNGYQPEKDNRHFLYKEYLRILADHRPPVFVMENVKGILSSKIYEAFIFDKIIEDLRNPASSYSHDIRDTDRRSFHYEIFSLVNGRATYDQFGKLHEPRNFIIKSEKYGVPQSRHRVILLGVRSDMLKGISPFTLEEEKEIPVSKVIQGLPRLRSGLSLREEESDSRETWRECIKLLLHQNWLSDVSQIAGREVYDNIIYTINNMRIPQKDKGGEFITYNASIGCKRDWYLDDRIGGICNHTARNHLIKDLHRYFYAACFSQVKGYSPMLAEYPRELLPNH